MLGRLAILTVLAAVSACDAPPKAPAPSPALAKQEVLVVLSAQKIQDRSALCERKARETFQRDAVGVAATFVHHYSIKLDTCFYLLTVTRQETISRKLLDINENETYGEFLGAETGSPATCRAESLYCASLREWEVLVEPYMRD